MLWVRYSAFFSSIFHCTHKQLINLIHSDILPGVTVGVGVTIEPLEEDGTCVLPVKGYITTIIIF